jgi:Pyridoxamine 5'-phosphate oxidase
MALTKSEREEFLAEPHVAALSVSAGPDRGPLTVPIWYQYTPGGQPWLLTGLNSRKHKLIEEAGRFSLMAERVEPSVRYVSVDGTVAGVDTATDDQLVEMSARYVPPDRLDGYLAFARESYGDQVVIYLQPEHWLSADLGAL